MQQLDLHIFIYDIYESICDVYRSSFYNPHPMDEATTLFLPFLETKTNEGNNIGEHTKGFFFSFSVFVYLQDFALLPHCSVIILAGELYIEQQLLYHFGQITSMPEQILQAHILQTSAM
ncbi:hypothetical protein ACJX0J_023851 [Zea mays]